MKLYVAGGRVLDREFIASLVPPQGMRVLLYRNLAPGFAPAELIDAGGPGGIGARSFVRWWSRWKRSARRRSARSAAAASAETFHALPLTGRENNLLGVLLIASSRRDLVELESSLRAPA